MYMYGFFSLRTNLKCCKDLTGTNCSEFHDHHLIFRSPNSPANLQTLYPGLQWEEFTSGRSNYLEIEPRMSENSSRTGLAARADHFWNNLVPEAQEDSRHH